MSTPQARPKTPPTEYGPSVTPPTFEEINLYHLSIVIESSESDAATTDNAIATIETGEANEYSNCKDSGHVSQYVLITAYLALIVNAILMSAVIIVLIQLIIYANHYEKRRGDLILWCIIEVLWRLWPIVYTAKQASTSYAIIHLLGIFLGKEHYLTLVNSFWPDSDPFEAAVDLSGIRIDPVLLFQNVEYATFNLLFGIWFWVETWIAVNHSSDDYAKLLAITGLSACLINIVSHVMAGCNLLEYLPR